MNSQRSDIGEVMNHIAETGTSMNYRNNQKPEKKYFPGVLMVLMSVVILLLLSALVARSAYADQVTIVPGGVVGAGGWTGVTAGNLSDSDDGTYATITAALDTFTVSMSNDAAYSGATITNVRVYVRGAAIGGSGQPEQITLNPGRLGQHPVTELKVFRLEVGKTDGRVDDVRLPAELGDRPETERSAAGVVENPGHGFSGLSGGQDPVLSQHWKVIDPVPGAAARHHSGPGIPVVTE